VRLRELAGQARAADVLGNAIRRGRVAHAYLFCGPEGVGKSTAARLFAQALNCEGDARDADGDACGECESCRLMEKGIHPDVRIITTPSPNHLSVIPIATIRQHLVYDANLRPVRGPYKVYVLDPADQTAPLAIHTTLKVLEEPPPYAVIILVTSRPALLPPTVLSRCQRVTFQLVGTATVEKHLLELDVEAPVAALLARLSGGRIAWATEAACRPQVLEARRALLDLCAGMSREGMGDALRVAEGVKLQALRLAEERREATTDEDHEGDEAEGDLASSGQPRFSAERALRTELPWCLDVMASWYRDRLGGPTASALINRDYQDALQPAAGPAELRRAREAVTAILAARQQVQRNANIDLALEALAIKLLAGGE
jgi:DNA polymerase-3 subunit delta'